MPVGCRHGTLAVITLPETRFTRLIGCRLPIQQAGMGAVATPALAAAVADAGGLGTIGGAGRSADDVASDIDGARSAASQGGVIGVNFLVPFLDERAVAAAAQRARVVEFFYGDPAPPIVGLVHDAGALVCWQVGSVDEALAAEAAGCDVVVVQGIEAGGHIRGAEPLLPLLEAVVGAVGVPLVAAGGIGTGRGVAQVLTAGADGARVGTCLLATVEADVHPSYADALIHATAADTVITEAFSMGWPRAPHRVLRACVDASAAEPAHRSPVPPTRSFAGDVGAAALYAGTSVSDVHRVEPAAAVIRRLEAEAAEHLRR